MKAKEWNVSFDIKFELRFPVGNNSFKHGGNISRAVFKLEMDQGSRKVANR